jgi:hypothetical protein
MIDKAVKMLKMMDVNFFNDVSRIQWQSPRAGALGYVSSDSPNVVNLDKQKIEQHAPMVNAELGIDSPIAAIAAVLAHEVGHVEDEKKRLDSGGQNPFPRGEKVADAMKDKAIQWMKQNIALIQQYL